ncbi:MAG: hypothetical protein HY822_10090 [Acidobacteria bacterium]|nr:hypothetical protein [Acidobacteriota bacterium]
MEIGKWYVAVAVLLALALPASAQYSTPMRDIENPAHSPLRLKGTGDVPGGFVGAFGMTIGPALAADRRMVIEYVLFDCGTAGAVEPVRVQLSTAEKTGAGSYSFHNYLINLAKTTPDYAGNVRAVGTQSQRWYHDGGQAVQIGITLNGAAPAAGITCRVEISGYTTSMP